MFRTMLFLYFLVTGLASIHAQTTIPFQMRGGLILFDIQLEGKNGKFVFDSGAATTVIDSATADELQLKIASSRNVPGATGSTVLNVISNVKMKLVNQVALAAPSAVLVNLKPLEEVIGEHFDGIIGYELLKRYIVNINYDEKTITLLDQITNAELVDYTPIPFNFNNGVTIPQFEIAITLQKGKSLAGQVFFDSGAAASIIINTPFKNDNQLQSKIGKTLVSRSHDLHKETISEDARIKSVDIGPFTLNDLPVSLSNASAGVNAYPGYLGILGNNIIKRFNIIYDYRVKNIYLKPNQGFKRNFDFPLSGLQLKKSGEDILIKTVIEGTEAFEKGIKAGQRLIRVDGYSGTDLDQFKEKLKQNGKTVNITLRNSDGALFETTILLKPLI